MTAVPPGLGVYGALTANPRMRPAARMELLSGFGGQQQQPGGLNIQAALRTGIGAADGLDPIESDVGAGYPLKRGDGSDLGDFSPDLLKLAQSMYQDSGGEMVDESGGMMDDAPLSAQDKGLGLAQIGFGIAAGQSPNALSNIGAGAMQGIEGLQRLRQQRALQRMREAQMIQQAELKREALAEAERAAKERAEVQRDAIAQREAAAAAATAQREADSRRDAISAQALADARAATARAETERADDRAAALLEQRYATNDRQRMNLYATTGQWQTIPGDEERGITGAPVGDTYSGPRINDPTIPLKERNQLKSKQPDQTLATKVVRQRLGETVDLARELKTHPGKAAAVGLPGPTSAIPGSAAWDYLNKLSTLKDQMFVRTLQAIRDASKTGGAVGNVSDKEGNRFENVSAPLSRWSSEKELDTSLDTLIEEGKFLDSRYLERYNETYGDLPPDPDERETPPKSSDGTVVTDKEAEPVLTIEQIRKMYGGR